MNSMVESDALFPNDVSDHVVHQADLTPAICLTLSLIGRHGGKDRSVVMVFKVIPMVEQSNLNHFYEQYGGERRALPK